MLVVGFSLETDRKIDGYGLRVTKIGAGVVASVLLALHLHHGDMSKAGVYGYCHFRRRYGEPCPGNILTLA